MWLNLTRNEAVVTTLSLTIMRKSVRKLIKKQKVETEENQKNYDHLITLFPNFEGEEHPKETYLVKLDYTSRDMLKGFLTSYIDKLKKSLGRMPTKKESEWIEILSAVLNKAKEV